MLIANTNLIPSPDMLGMPIAPWISQVLMALTLALHWVFIAIIVGGGVFYFTSKNDSSEPLLKARQGLASFLPFGLSMAMTLGIAPLLFVQVLYGNFFYSSTIMIGWVWMGLLPLTAVNLYLLFIARHQASQHKSSRLIAGVVLLLMAVSAVILSSNSTLLQNPQDWDWFRTQSAGKPYLTGPTLWPRLSLAFCTLFAGGNLFVALYLRFKLEADDTAARQKIVSRLKMAIVGIAAALLACFWVSRSLPDQTWAVLSGRAEVAFAYAAAGALLLTLGLTVLSLGARMLYICLGSVTFFVALLCAAFTRDALRRAALSEYFDLYEITVKNQWSSLMLFLVIFVLGLLLVAYMVNLAITSRQKPLEA